MFVKLESCEKSLDDKDCIMNLLIFSLINSLIISLTDEFLKILPDLKSKILLFCVLFIFQEFISKSKQMCINEKSYDIDSRKSMNRKNE